MRDFLIRHWKKDFDDYLPPHLDGRPTNLRSILQAFESAVTTGYNILYYSSCSSGSVSNWVGVKSPCADDDTLNCRGVGRHAGAVSCGLVRPTVGTHYGLAPRAGG